METLLQTETRISEFKLPPLINRTNKLPAFRLAPVFCSDKLTRNGWQILVYEVGEQQTPHSPFSLLLVLCAPMNFL